MGYFQCDNINSNSCTTKYVLQALFPDIINTIVFQKLQDYWRFRCFGYIFNLVAKAFLDGNVKDFTKSIIYEVNRKRLAKEKAALLANWRKKGPVGKLYNIIYFICRSL